MNQTLKKIKRELYKHTKGAYALWQLKKNILSYYAQLSEEEYPNDLKGALGNIRKNGLQVFPYPFAEKYSYESVQVYYDEESGMPYVSHNGKRLFFPKTFNIEFVKFVYNFLLIEQDEDSPHKYLIPDFEFPEGAVLFDVGAAEGILSLDLVEKASKIYLFEVDPKWLEALQKTFEPWSEKVVIVNKYVSDSDSENTVTIDSITNNFGTSKIFFKLDVEGVEKSVIEGASETLNSDKFEVKAAICTYHQQNDFEELSAIMKGKGYKVTPSQNHMLFFFNTETQKPPYFRRGLIYCQK